MHVAGQDCIPHRAQAMSSGSNSRSPKARVKLLLESIYAFLLFTKLFRNTHDMSDNVGTSKSTANGGESTSNPRKRKYGNSCTVSLDSPTTGSILFRLVDRRNARAMDNGQGVQTA